MKARTVEDVIARLPAIATNQRYRLPPPKYDGCPTSLDSTRLSVGLAVESMKCHTSDEGWQIFAGLEANGYNLAGHNLPANTTDIRTILNTMDPAVVVLQDKREWDVTHPGDFRDRGARFHGVELLARHSDIFKLTILKDAHQKPEYHRDSAKEIDCHAWIIYYHPRIVAHLAPYIRSQHLIRTYHSLDKNLVPKFNETTRDNEAILSGAVSSAYPLRQRLFKAVLEGQLPNTWAVKHPGYHRKGTATPEFLKSLNCFKVAICTSSIYGYALRKIIEATACGCRVITDLPVDEVLPEIDGNLTRIPVDAHIEDVGLVIEMLCTNYDTILQKEYADKAKAFYDYKAICKRLADDIEAMQGSYSHYEKVH